MIGSSESHGVPRWLSLARLELGVSEVKGPLSNPRIDFYHSHTRSGVTLAGDETPWCGSFVTTMLELSGVTSTKSKAARSYAVFGVRSPLVPGAIIVLRRGPSPAHGHVAFLERVDGDMLWLIGGNQGDAVSIRPYAMQRLVAARWPKGEPRPPSKPPGRRP